MIFEGQINEILFDGCFGVMFENGYWLIVYMVGWMWCFCIWLVVGDVVCVEVMFYDFSKGCFVYCECGGGLVLFSQCKWCGF